MHIAPLRPLDLNTSQAFLRALKALKAVNKTHWQQSHLSGSSLKESPGAFDADITTIYQGMSKELLYSEKTTPHRTKTEDIISHSTKAMTSSQSNLSASVTLTSGAHLSTNQGNQNITGIRQTDA